MKAHMHKAYGNVHKYINDVRRFLAIFDLPTFLRPILSDFDKATYIMTYPFLPKNHDASQIIPKIIKS